MLDYNTDDKGTANPNGSPRPHIQKQFLLEEHGEPLQEGWVSSKDSRAARGQSPPDSYPSDQSQVVYPGQLHIF